MTNTIKSLVFIISLFLFLSFYTVAANLINPYMNSISELRLLILFIAALMTAYILALLSQALVKYLYTNRQLKDANIILKLPLPPYKLNEKLIAHVLPAFAVLVPLFRERAFSPTAVASLISLAILIIILEIMFYLNSKTMHAYVTNKGIAIMGFDTRFEAALPFNYTNLSGFYPFERIDNFLAFPDRVFLYQSYDYSDIVIFCNPEESKQIKGLMLANKIPEKKLQ